MVSILSLHRSNERGARAKVCARLYNQSMSPAKKTKPKAKVKPKTEPVSDAAQEQQRILDSLESESVQIQGLPLEWGLKPVIEVRYARRYYPENTSAPYRMRDDLTVTIKEVVKYMAHCLEQTIEPEAVSEVQRLQFLARKHEFWLDENIPEYEKSISFDLVAWHKLGLRYAPDGNTVLREMLYQKLARRAWAGEGYLLEFLQPLSLNQAPKPVPEAMLKALQLALQQQMAEQRELVQQLQRFHAPVWVQAGTSKQLIQAADIALISSELRQGLAVYTLDGEQHLCFSSLGELENQFASLHQFMRTSRQHLVNLSQIRSVQSAGRGRDLLLRNYPDSLIARVTAAYLPAFLERMGQS